MDGDDRSDDQLSLPIDVLEGIAERLEYIVSSISDLAGTVTSLSAAVDAVEQKITTDGGATHLDATDQASVDAAVTDLGAVTAKLQAIVAPPAPAPAPVTFVDVTNADGSVTHADGTTTHPDGTVTNADGSPHIA